MRKKEKLSGPWPQRKVDHHRKQKEGMALILKDAQIGRTYVVEALHLPFELERRLEALGMTHGAKVTVLNRKGQGILIIKLRGSRFALGYNITKNIEGKEAGHEGE